MNLRSPHLSLSVPMAECTNIRMYEPPYGIMYTRTNVRMYKSTSAQKYKRTYVQISKRTPIQIDTCTQVHTAYCPSGQNAICTKRHKAQWTYVRKDVCTYEPKAKGTYGIMYLCTNGRVRHFVRPLKKNGKMCFCPTNFQFVRQKPLATSGRWRPERLLPSRNRTE